MPSSRAGFTLLELMIVTVIIGVLAMLATPLFTSSREEAYVATMKADLRNVVVAQESHLAENQVYASDVSALDFEPSDLVEIQIELADEDGGSPGGGPPGGGPPGGGPPGGGPPGGGGGSSVGTGERGWTAKATHRNISATCAIFVGNLEPFEPAEKEGVPACTGGG